MAWRHLSAVVCLFAALPSAAQTSCPDGVTPPVWNCTYLTGTGLGLTHAAACMDLGSNVTLDTGTIRFGVPTGLGGSNRCHHQRPTGASTVSCARDCAGVDPCSELAGSSFPVLNSTGGTCVEGCEVSYQSGSAGSIFSDTSIAVATINGGGCNNPQPSAEPATGEDIEESGTQSCVTGDLPPPGGDYRVCWDKPAYNSGDGTYITPEGDAEGATWDETEAPPPDGCNASGAVCDGNATTSPPLPDNGTPGQPAIPLFDGEFPDGTNFVAFSSNQLSNSTINTGGTDTDGGGGDPGTDVNVNVQVEFPDDLCTMGDLCDLTPAGGPSDFVADSGVQGAYDDIVQSIEDQDWTLNPAGDNFIQNPWLVSAGGACMVFPYNLFGSSGVWDAHCEPWNSFIRPALAWLIGALTIWYIWNLFQKVTTETL